MSRLTQVVARPSIRATRGISLLPSLLLYVVTSLLSSPASAQVATGTPPFGSFSSGADIVNVGNLNDHQTMPILHKPGRGMNFTYDLSYDSSVWYAVTSGSTTSWQPVSNLGWRGQTEMAVGYVSHVGSVLRTCKDRSGNIIGYEFETSNWVYHDQWGVPHPFSGYTIYISGTCGTGGPASFSSAATDGGGYNISVTDAAFTLYDSTGRNINPPSGGSGSATDRNGNFISVNSNGTFTDTLGSTALTVAGSGTPSSPVTFTYTAPSGASAHYTLNYTNFTIATNFGVPGINEYTSSAAVALPTSFVLPDGSQYSFSYEATPGSCTPYSGTTCVTARLASIIPPTGGTISYLYYNSNNNFPACTTGNNGIFSDGSTSCLQRSTPDGIWTYTRTLVSGNHYTTKVTTPPDPANSGSVGNDTVIDFQKDSATNPSTNNFYETQRVSYQGTQSSNNILQTVVTCYNGNTTSCTTTAVSSPITQRTIFPQYGSSGLQCEHNYLFDSVGGLTEQDDYDYGSGAPGVLLRQILITYASLPPNITAFRQQVTVKNGSGTVVAQKNYNYDENTPGSTSSWGITQHTSVSGSRGNLTSINYPVSGLTTHFTYWDTGVSNTSQDVNSATTTYNYGTSTATNCNGAFPIGITEAITTLTQSYTWNCTGGVMTSLTDENSQVTSVTYNDANFWRPANETFPDTGQTSWTYNSPTSITTTTKMNSSQNIVSTVLLDSLGRTSQAQLNSDPQGVDYSVVTYDALGRPYKAYNPTRCSPPTTNCGEATWGYTTTGYDALGRPTKITLQDGSVLNASYSNNTVTATDPAGNTRQSTLDSLGRLTQIIEDPGSSPHLNYSTSYSYDALGDLTHVTQNGSQQRTLAYDAMSRLTSETNPETGTITYKYDSDSNCASLNSSSGDLISRTDARNIRTCLQYDVLHRLTQKNYSDGTTPTAYYFYDLVNPWGTNYPYNYLGRLSETETTDSSGHMLTSGYFHYDPMGRALVHAECTPTNCPSPYPGFHTSFSYDLAGDLLSYATAENGITFSYQYDAAGRPTTATSSLVDSQHPGTLATVDSSVGYYPPGALRKMTLGNNLTQTAAFNNALQPCRVNVNSSGTALGACADATPSGNVQDFSYGFNAGSTDNGNAVSWTAIGQQAFNRAFTYDSLNRLATLNQSSGAATGCSATFNLSWTYDSWGNRTDQTVNSGTCNAFHAGVNTNNQLSGSPYQYDAAGNMTNDGNHTYFYDAEERLVQVDGSSGYCTNGSGTPATACYSYDALGQRTQKTVGSAITQYVRDLGGQVILETDGNGNGNPTADYIYMVGNLAAEYKNSTTYFAHSDHLGSTRLLTAVDQSIAQNLDYLPFGELNSSDSGITTHKFTGDERDSETNLDHTQFRQYSSQLGRWMHPDPVGLAAVDPSNPQSWNRYAYVLNNPMNFSDPLGLECVWDNGSYDSSDDPASGSQSACQKLGGTWMDPGFFSDFGMADWSASPNDGLAAAAYAIQNGFALVQTGSGVNGWMLVANGGAGPIDWSLLINPPGPTSPAIALGRAINATGIQALNPDVCGGGYFVGRGVEVETGAVHGGSLRTFYS